MRRLLLLGWIMTAGALYADINDDVWSGDDTSVFDTPPNDREDEVNGPFFVRAGFDLVGNAEFSKGAYKGEKFRFSEFDLDGSAVIYYNECKREGFAFTLGYSRYNLDWHQNPFFHEKNFNVISTGIGFFSHRLDRWDWKGLVKMNFDPCHLNFQDYVNWDLMVWGRYDLGCNWGFHTGFYALTGMKIDRVYPIIGFDWTINERWKLNAIFPMNFSVIYTYDCHWSFALASRIWDVRRRAGQDEPLPKALWEYRNVGVELAANYKMSGWNFNAHVGYATGGRLKISDRHRSHSHRLNFNAAPYVGGEVAYNF